MQKEVKLQNNKQFFIVLLLIISSFSLFAQTTKFKGTMTVGNYTRNNVVLQLVEKNNKADGTIFNTKFARLMPKKVDASIKGLNRTKKDNKVYISGNNLIPYVKDKPKEKYIITNFNGVKTNDELIITTYFGDKKVTYNGKKIK